MNHGASIPDTEAIGPFQESIEQWRRRNDIEADDQIKIVKLSHMRYQHPDLREITTFLQDFGLVVAKETTDEVWYRGYGPDQYVYYARRGPRKFLGGCFEVESYRDLEKAAKLEGASDIHKLDIAPGGGSLITLTDAEGIPMNLIYGQGPAEPELGREKLVLNYEQDKPRVRKFQRFKEGPAAVYKLGHYGLTVTDFELQSKWYTQHFNIVPTDFLYVPGDDGSKKIVAVFAHIDRGKDLVDHHTIFLSTAAKSHVHHCSFEVHDFDTQQLGHQWLANKGYKSVWGVGRHILGSQIFDYWWDTTGNMIEHYADGDLVNEDTPIGLLPAGEESLAVWGPDVPAAFLD